MMMMMMMITMMLLMMVLWHWWCLRRTQTLFCLSSLGIGTVCVKCPQWSLVLRSIGHTLMAATISSSVPLCFVLVLDNMLLCAFAKRIIRWVPNIPILVLQLNTEVSLSVWVVSYDSYICSLPKEQTVFIFFFSSLLFGKLFNKICYNSCCFTILQLFHNRPCGVHSFCSISCVHTAYYIHTYILHIMMVCKRYRKFTNIFRSFDDSSAEEKNG